MKRSVEKELLKMQNSDSSDNEPLIRKTVSWSSNNKRKRDEEEEGMIKEKVARKKKSRLATDNPVSPDSEIERVEKDLTEGESGEEDGSERGDDLGTSGESLEEKNISQKTATKQKDDLDSSGDSEEEEWKMSEKMTSKQNERGKSWREKQVTSESDGTSEEELGTLSSPKGRIHKKRDPGIDFEVEEMEEKQVGTLRRPKSKAVESDYEEENGPKKTSSNSKTEEMEGTSESEDQGNKRIKETQEKVRAEKKRRALKNKRVRSESEGDGDGEGENNQETPRKRVSKWSHKSVNARCGSAGEGEKRQTGENGDDREATDLSEKDKGKEEEKMEEEEEKKSASGSDSDSSSLPSLEEESESKPEQGKKMMKRKKIEESEGGSKGRKEEENKSVSRLKHYIALCGVRRNYKKLLDGCRSVKAKVTVLKKELEDLGVTGQPSIEKCKKARLKREEAQELAELDLSNILTTQGRPKRRGTSVWPPPKSITPPSSYKRVVTSESDSDEDNRRDKERVMRPDWSKLRGIISDDGDSD